MQSKGEIQAFHLSQLKNDWYSMTTDMFNEYSSDANVTHRVKNGIPFLGRVAHYLFDVVGPDENQGLKDLEQ